MLRFVSVYAQCRGGKVESRFFRVWGDRKRERWRERKREIERGRRDINLVRVDPQLEGHSAGKLVPFTAGRDVVGVDLALDVDVLIGRNVQELDSDQRL